MGQSLLRREVTLQVLASNFKRAGFCPGWCSSVNRAQACESKGHRFDPQSGHMPGLQAGAPVGGHVRGNHTSMFLSLSPSLPLSLKINFLKKEWDSPCLLSPPHTHIHTYTHTLELLLLLLLQGRFWIYTCFLKSHEPKCRKHMGSMAEYVLR